MNNIVNNTTTANVINTSDIATNRNIVLCGVGGQGTVLASKLLAAAAMSKDIQTSYRNTKRLFLRCASDDRLSEETCGKSDSYRCRYYLPGNRFSESIEHGTFRCSYPHRSFRFFP